MKRPMLVCLLSSLVACATITPVAYQPQPERIADPATEVRSLILANTTQGCVTEPDLTPAMLTVKFVCSNGVGNSVVRFDRVDSIVIEESGGWYRVQVRHTPGTEPFQWTSKNLDDMTRLADAITALAKGGQQSVPEATPTTVSM
jgi:hypothetical protein